MSDLITLHEAIAAELQTKTSLRGITIRALDRQEIESEINQALDHLGAAIQIGTVEGRNRTPGSIQPQVIVTPAVEIIENVTIWRGKPLNAGSPVANQAARLALAGTISVGERVVQTDSGLTYWLISGTGASLTDWGVVWTAAEIAQLVIRSLNGWRLPSDNTIMTLDGFDFRYLTAGEVSVLVTFQTVFHLSMTPVE